MGCFLCFGQEPMSAPISSPLPFISAFAKKGRNREKEDWIGFLQHTEVFKTILHAKPVISNK